MCVYMFVCVCIKVLYIFNKYALLIGFVLFFQSPLVKQALCFLVTSVSFCCIFSH